MRAVVGSEEGVVLSWSSSSKLATMEHALRGREIFSLLRTLSNQLNHNLLLFSYKQLEKDMTKCDAE